MERPYFSSFDFFYFVFHLKSFDLFSSLIGVKRAVKRTNHHQKRNSPEIQLAFLLMRVCMCVWNGTGSLVDGNRLMMAHKKLGNEPNRSTIEEEEEKKERTCRRRVDTKGEMNQNRKHAEGDQTSPTAAKGPEKVATSAPSKSSLKKKEMTR